jgi:hypothetical protein
MEPSERLILQRPNVVDEMRDADPLDDARAVEPDRCVRQVVQVADPAAEQDRHQVDTELVNQAGVETPWVRLAPLSATIRSPAWALALATASWTPPSVTNVNGVSGRGQPSGIACPTTNVCTPSGVAVPAPG